MTHTVAQPGLGQYAVNNVLDGALRYVGKVRQDGAWIIERCDAQTGGWTYANVSNNPSQVGGYGAAWAAAATLTYGAFNTLSGV